MATATFRFYEELNDFLPPPRKKQDIVIEFDRRNSIKDMIESLGVPHTEIDLILVNQEPVDFSYIVADQDRISVYPMFESLDISPWYGCGRRRCAGSDLCWIPTWANLPGTCACWVSIPCTATATMTMYLRIFHAGVKDASCLPGISVC